MEESALAQAPCQLQRLPDSVINRVQSKSAWRENDRAIKEVRIRVDDVIRSNLKASSLCLVPEDCR